MTPRDREYVNPERGTVPSAPAIGRSDTRWEPPNRSANYRGVRDRRSRMGTVDRENGTRARGGVVVAEARPGAANQ